MERQPKWAKWAKWSTMMLAVHDAAMQTQSRRAAETRSAARRRERRIGFSRRW